MYGVCKTFGKKGRMSKLFKAFKQKKGWKVYSTIRFPFEWREA